MTAVDVVRALAAVEDPAAGLDGQGVDGICGCCGTAYPTTIGAPDSTDPLAHPPSCAWRMAREWCATRGVTP